jgi:hypothetical protein
MIGRIVRLALIALLVAVGVHLWYGRVAEQLQARLPAPSPAAANAPAAAARPAAGAVATARVDTRVILKRNIFKAALEADEQPAGSRELDLDALEETRMQLVLLGTVSGSREDARAIIRDEAAKKEDIYQVGSDIQGALIARIERGRVVLQVNGREEILNIKDPESGRPRPGGPNFRPPGMPGDEAVQPAEIMPPEVDDRKVPQALPRRRINFRAAPLADRPPAEPADNMDSEEPADISPPPVEVVTPEEAGEAER